MDNQWSLSLSDSNSDSGSLLLLISSDSAETKPTRRILEQDDDRRSTVGANEKGVEATVYGNDLVLSDLMLRKMKVRNNPSKRKPSGSEAISNDKMPEQKTGNTALVSSKSRLSQKSSKREEDLSIRKLTNKSEDSSRFTEQTGRSSERTGTSSIGSWLRKTVLRRRTGQTPKSSSNGNGADAKAPWNKGKAIKQIPQQVVYHGNADVGEEISTLRGSMSTNELRKAFESKDSLIGSETQTFVDIDVDPSIVSEFADDPSSARGKFQNLLEIYKASGGRGNNNSDVLSKVKKLNKGASFTLISFSVAPSESESTDDEDSDGEDSSSDGDETSDDEESMEDNLADAIAKEMNLRRLVMGDRGSSPRIREVSIPVAYKEPSILSPRMNTPKGRTRLGRPVLTAVHKPLTPLEQLSGFFFGDENVDSPRPTCGSNADLQTVPTLPPGSKKYRPRLFFGKSP